MYKSKYKIIARILVLALLLATIMQATSCSFLFSYLGDLEQGDGSGGGSDNGGDSGNGSGSGDSGGENNDPVVPDFYPSESFDPADLSAAHRTLLSIVRIIANHEKYTDYGYEYDYSLDSETLPYYINGSGVIYQLDKATGSAYIITNFHVVYHQDSAKAGKISDDIKLYLYGQEREDYAISAKYVGGSLTQDIAVLRVENSEVLKNSNAEAATLANSDLVNVFDTVIAVGNPEGLGLSVTSGIVSVDSESLTMVGADRRTGLNLRVIRISAAINEGNSGGGLYDVEGRLIGIVNAKRTGDSVDNIAYAIPINLAKNLADAIITYCDGETNLTPKKCLLGITLSVKAQGLTINPDNGTIEKAEQVVITGVNSDSLFVGKIGVDDIIDAITIDGVRHEVTRTFHITDYMISARVGSEVTLHITRGSVQTSFTEILTSDTLVDIK